MALAITVSVIALLLLSVKLFKTSMTAILSGNSIENKSDLATFPLNPNDIDRKGGFSPRC